MRQSGRAFQTSKANEQVVNQIDVNKVSDVAGAEILNVNLSKPIPKFTLKKIMEAFTQHHVLIFRQQNLSKIEQENFTQNFTFNFGSRQLRTQSVEPHSDRAKRRIRPSSVTNGGCDKPIARSDLMVGTGIHGEQLRLV